MIKFSHSIFALPFALVSGLVAWRSGAVEIGLLDVMLLLVCMVSARSAAMGFNRIVDRSIDARNPRTSSRELPQGVISARAAIGFTAASALVFMLAAAAINPLCGFLSLPVLGLLLGYSLTKRYTSAAHLVLGACLGTAPVGVWFALTGSFSWTPILLGIGVMLWTAGFDIYYSCQDEEFDRANGLLSIPARFGRMWAIRSVRVMHALALLAFLFFGVLSGMGPVFYLGMIAIATILFSEAWILRGGDLARINIAFFNLNGYVSVLFAFSVILDIAVRPLLLRS